MKKLMVFAAVAAMALGAKAEYYTYVYNIPNAQAVYAAADGGLGADGYEYYKQVWGIYKQVFFDADFYEDIFEDGQTTWAGRYATIREDFYPKANKTEAGVFVGIDEDGGYHESGYISECIVMAILDADEISPGANYVVYYGQVASGDMTTIPMSPLIEIDSGTLLTDASPVPEPTSGLLLLLGMAGLALKRKLNG